MPNNAEQPNLFVTPPPGEQEFIETLAQGKNVRIERIVSAGHTGGWQNQSEAEFVALLQGEATLAFAGGREERMTAGSCIQIPAGQRHKVSYTSAEPPCVWLCFFYEE